jgi:hypothetical protein
MQAVQPMKVLCAAIISTTCMLAAPAMAGENKFVFVSRADSPGNDLLRVENSSFEDCERRCDGHSECNAFTYNQRHGVCFLKYAANRQLTFYAFATTGVRLSPSVPPTASASGTGPSIVILPQADSPGNDYSQIHLSLEECRRKCEADARCEAYSYNLARGVCFLKRAANQWTSFYAWGITGIKLSPPPKPATTAPVPTETVTPPQQVQSSEPPTAPSEPSVTAPSE